MNTSSLPTIIETDQLAAILDQSNLIIVDMSPIESYQKAHISGAIHLSYAELVEGTPPAPGLLPSRAKLQNALSTIGLDAHSHVIAYDNDTGGKACRLLWTLDVVGHQHWSFLNGGLTAWTHDNYETEDVINVKKPSDYHLPEVFVSIAYKETVLNAIDDDQFQIIDARSPDEYNGVKSASARSGHIPGSVNFNWLDSMDSEKQMRIKSKTKLESMLVERGIMRENPLITHCQTHHRSSQSYVMFKSLGFENVLGYAGSWSEWGNDFELPIESN